MPGGFLPYTDDGLLLWSQNFSTQINASWQELGLDEGDPVAYEALHAAYAQAMAASAPGVRSKATTASKNQARESLKTAARFLARRIYGMEGVTAAQRHQLGLTVRAKASPIPPPDHAPAVDVIAVMGRTVRLRLHDATVDARAGRPKGVAGATVFWCADPGDGSEPANYTFACNTTRTFVDVTVPPTVAPGSVVWIRAQWRNARDQAGPLSMPVYTHIQFGLSMAG